MKGNKIINKTNPNGANRVVIDPRQTPFLEYLWGAKGETYLDIEASALKAGYSPKYAENLKSLMPDWLWENIGKVKRIKKAERNVDKVLDLETKVEDKEEPQLLRIQADMSKFILSVLDKENYGESKQNLVFNTVVFNDEQSLEIARRRLAGNNSSEKAPD